ncbi:MAG TPA: EAL domain-containing protein [Longimicrobiaceae bacterium]|nr:EAL domain-containing protein [Longimicrobiaceae bacterium]
MTEILAPYTLLPGEPRRPARETPAHEAIQRALRESEEYFRSLVENARDVIHVINEDGTTRYITPSVRRLLGWDPEELIGRHALQLVHPDDVERAREVLRLDRHTPGAAASLEFRAPHADGTWRIFEAIGKNLLDDPVVRGIVVNSRDVTERKRAEAESVRLAAIPRENPYPIVECDAQARIVYLNPSAERLLAELGAEGAHEILPGAHALLVRECVASGQGARGVEVRAGCRILAWTYHPHPSLGTVHLFGEEVTERKRVEEQLRHDAMHDALTGLPNRHLFMERLGRLVERRRRGGTGFAVLFLDLDRFKVVNDSLGHHVGDELLVEVARRLRECAAGDTVARLGGDEFAVLLESVAGEDEARAAAELLAEVVAVPVVLSGYEVFTGASVGIALGSGGERPEHLLRNADMAMYRAKASGVARCEVFDRAMHDAALGRLRLETDLRRAAERGEFRLHYQPIVSLRTGAIAGVEALLRWQHPVRGLIPPAEFVPVAEETGAILPIGDWVMREGCRQLAEWRAEFPRARMAVSINLSAKQFAQRDLVEKIADTLRETGLDPRHLKLEITESAVMESTESAGAMLRQLKALGIQVQMDDFGTGYSSLSSLHRLPLDGLKIDRSFIGRMEEENGTGALVRTIAVLARGLGLAVIAEGVETQAQLEGVRELGCDYAQGYLISRPVDTEGIRAFLAAGQCG